MSEEILRRLDELKTLVSGKGPVRVELCTQAAFDRLPALVPRAVFMAWTGYTANELKEETDEKHIAVYKPKGKTKALYYKREIARLGGWRM